MCIIAAFPYYLIHLKHLWHPTPICIGLNAAILNRSSCLSRHLGCPFNSGKSIMLQQQFHLCCFTTLDILAMNSPFVGLPFSALTVLPK